MQVARFEKSFYRCLWVRGHFVTLHQVKYTYSMNFYISIKFKSAYSNILEEARVEPIAMVMRRLQWFGHVRRDETENSQAVAETKMEVKRPRRKHRQ